MTPRVDVSLDVIHAPRRLRSNPDDGRMPSDLGVLVEPPVGIEPTTFSLRGAFGVCMGGSHRLRTAGPLECFGGHVAAHVAEWGQHGDSAHRIATGRDTDSSLMRFGSS